MALPTNMVNTANIATDTTIITTDTTATANQEKNRFSKRFLKKSRWCKVFFANLAPLIIATLPIITRL